jgi:hypothetical protein
MTRRRRGALQVEPLEGKVLLSTAAARAHAVAKHVAPLPFSIAGTLQMPTNSVATFQLSGQNMGTFKVRGKLGTMGQVTGTFVAALDANNNMIAGQLVLTAGRKGSVTLNMTNHPTDQTAYAYTVIAGTGAFASATGTGKMATVGVANGGRAMLFAVTPS